MAIPHYVLIEWLSRERRYGFWLGFCVGVGSSFLIGGLIGFLTN